ncbi:N,N-dimethylformamidase beta subunit [Roseobacter fucihabitans]|uniref:N,N-dimethylformamidase beta subunit n=1 Tax=Roseobacter fucihabitans TaxID=1537242 RepID=A0ABZ2BU98_9RHOB|nr:N,N-dimethylformamidase beta subunit family domain-containing protein [Roseobacter litoralis]MBC6966074.1 N,N-dimethylformamidase beta subunit [Roseobacter litoralis]
MATQAKDIPLLGYVDRLSGRPGDTLNFKVSSTSASPFRARLMRAISADPNPKGPGIIEEEADRYFTPARCASVHRPFAAGSYGIGRTGVSATPNAEVILSAHIYPTLQSEQVQSVIGIGRYDLSLHPGGGISLAVDGRAITLENALPLRQWYVIKARITRDSITVSQRPVGHKTTTAQEITGPGNTDLSLSGRPTIGAHLIDAVPAQQFNGKIEAPQILVDGQMLCQWDFASDISSRVVPAQSGPDLELINYPTRAVTGSAWDGSEMNWTHKPAHYAAIHFHPDDIYDFGWDTDFSYRLPQDIPSGVYVMRLSCDGHEDAIPFFVCPPSGQPKAKLCVLVSTFTYAIYGNHARPDYKPAWLDRIRDWNAYPHNPAEHPEYGLSTYNYHADGSGICHASHKRPLFNLRPGYLTFGEAICSGLRHFPADMHLIAWLHAKGIEYDIVTDRELHDDGVAAIAGYRAVTTGSHPEYHTSQTLDALRDYRDGGGHLLYLGGNGFYWRVALHPESEDMLEIRRAEDGIRAWAAEPGEYYNAFDGTYGGLWRRNGRAPQDLVGIGFAAQGEFFGDPYRRICTDPAYDWVFEGVENTLIGDYGYSGNGAAGFELDHMDYRLGTPQNAVLLAQSVTRDNGFMLVPEEQLTHLTNLTGGTAKEAMHADMVLIEYPGGGSVFATGSITFCGCLPWNGYKNDVSRLLQNVITHLLGAEH